MLSLIRDAYRDYEVAAKDVNVGMAYGGSEMGFFVGILDEGDYDLAPAVDSGNIACGHPYIEKFFRSIRFVGSGTIFVRVFVDGNEAASGRVEMTEDHTAPRYMNLPRGLAGMNIRVLWTGTSHGLRYYEIDWDFVSPSEARQ